MKKRWVIAITATLALLWLGLLSVSLYGSQLAKQVETETYGNTKSHQVKSLVKSAFKASFNGNKHSEALVLLEKAHAIEPENRSVSLKLARTYIRCDRDSEARTLLASLLNRDDWVANQARKLLAPEMFVKFKRTKNVF